MDAGLATTARATTWPQVRWQVRERFGEVAEAIEGFAVSASPGEDLRTRGDTRSRGRSFTSALGRTLSAAWRSGSVAAVTSRRG